MKLKILLVSPAGESDVHRRILSELPFLSTEAFFAPHACAVVAGLTPAPHEVHIHDENLNGPVDRLLERGSYDVVGISLSTTALERTRAIAALVRGAGRRELLVAGGACVLHMLPRLKGLLDVVFVGEAEETWPRFLQELAEGRHQPVYRQISKPDLARVPVPRWDLIGKDIPRYTIASVQTNRGCPNDCSFCDVVYTFGRKLRRKSIDQVIEEVRLLASLEAEMIYFADDNFAADREHTKALLRRLVALNRTLATRLTFSTQAEISVAEDDELLQLMLDANVQELQIGIESVNAASLEDIQKSPNLRVNLVEAIKKIQSYGIVVLAHTMVGIDSDDHSAFAQLERFIVAANIVHQGCHLLMAPPGTKLWYQLRRAGRLIEVSDEMFGEMMMEMSTNIIPKNLTRLELMEGVTAHLERVTAPEHFLGRARAFIRGVSHRPSFKVDNEPSLWAVRKKLVGLVRYYLLQAPKAERRVFLQLLAETARANPELFPRAIFAIICHQLERQQLMAPTRRAIAARERLEPARIQRMEPAGEIAEGFRKNAREIIVAAYRHVREKTADRDTLYQSVVEAMVDYNDRFGESCAELDDYHRDAILKSCERVTSRLSADAPTDAEPLGAEPPGGFTREIVDAMDQTLRYFSSPAERDPAPSRSSDA
jgi:radical SAM superfamily enzyme YgiQ (UPF0313 family)